MVCKLRKSLYGLKQVSRPWYLKFDKFITSFGFIENKVDENVYLKITKSKYIFLILYVDDILLLMMLYYFKKLNHFCLKILK